MYFDSDNKQEKEEDNENGDSEEDETRTDTSLWKDSDAEMSKDKKKKNRREKGPPIVCIMCKTVWTKSRRGGRLFMFGGTRPFMAKFEAKFKALMGPEDLVALQKKSATKFGRSYVCRECYLLVRQTYDNIRRLQRCVSKSVCRIQSLMGLTSLTVKGERESDSDQDLNFDSQAHMTPKKKLPPVAERIAEKIANMTLIKINFRTPRIVLECEAVDNKQHRDEKMNYVEKDCDNLDDSSNASEVADDGRNHIHQSLSSSDNGAHTSVKTGLQISNASQENSVTDRPEDLGNTSQQSMICASQTTKCLAGDDEARPQTENIYSSREAEECSAISLNMDTSFASQHIVMHRPALQPANTTAPISNPVIRTVEDANSLNSCSSTTPTVAELTEILANPLLLIKAPQPVKLADVKNENVYICGEGGCDWIFTSRFFWENHIRHYHRSGKPFICSFEGCGRSFTGKSKLELHERSHTDERPFICDKCGSGFRGNQELRAHRLTHTSDKPHQCPKCDKNFKLLSSLKRHLQFHDGGDFPYPCTYQGCEKAFKSRYDLKCHYRLHTGEKPYRCPEPGCGMAFRIPCQFTMHKRSHTGERPFKCPEEGCSAAYISSNALQAHMLSHTSERPFCCEFCGKTFKHKVLYRMHLKKHSGPEGLVCPFEDCREEHADRNSLDQHMMTHHGIQDYKAHNKKTYECPEEGCGLKYSTDGGLRYHRLKVHKKEKVPSEEELDCRRLICPYYHCEKEYEEANGLRDHLTKAHMSIPREKMCPLCGMAFPHTEELQVHKNNFHNECSVLKEQLKGVFVCNSERCGLRFHRLEELKHHVTWHLGNPPYRCEFEECGRTFLLESMYSNHVMEHENLKPFTCSFEHCQEGFTSRIKVLKHSKMHYGLFRCPIDGCTKSLQTLSSARIHLQHHEKPFVCQLCGKRFTCSSQWAKHKRSHTGEKVYECKICTSHFPDSESLKAHKRIHKGEKRYICEECGQRFSSQVARKSHMKSHSTICPFELGELPFTCSEEGCGKAFREIGSLKAHQSIHSKPSHLCTQCGKVYKLSVSKHKCKVEPEEHVVSEVNEDYLQQQQLPQQQEHQQQQQPMHQLAPPANSLPQSHPSPVQSLPLPVPALMSQTLSQSVPQSIPQTIAHSMSHAVPQPLTQPLTQTLNQQMPQQPPPQQYLSNMMMSEPGAQPFVMEEQAIRHSFGTADTIVVDPPYYNYIILYDRPVQQ